ncbi:MAG: histidine--tRNA ligase [Dehalococcoidia bacterium]|nr:histidine--tRNA ligase [Dehalococcoidia bacterium]
MYQAPRGTSDILPEDQPYWQFIRNKASEVATLFGYQRIDTPIFEDASLFVRGVGEGTDIVDKEMYVFKDQGGENLSLRPEATAAMCRAYLEHGMQNLPQPVKLFTVGPFFRYDRPQAGRYRQFHQFNCEALGEADPLLDAEAIEVAWRFYESLGLRDLSLQINSIGCPACRPAHRAQLMKYYEALLEEVCRECRGRFVRNPLRLLDCKEENCQRLATAAPRTADHLCEECRDHFVRLQAYLTAAGIPFNVNNRLVRGLDYYTKTVFEIQPAIEGAQASLGGGGRYDGLIEGLGGKSTPGIGFAAGLERVVINLKRQGIKPDSPAKPRVFVAYLGAAAREAAWKVVSELRQSAIASAIGFGGRSLKSQLRQANTLGVAYVVIIGDSEVERGEANVRDMASATQMVVPLAGLCQALAATG